MPLHFLLQDDFEKARAAFNSGDYETAVPLFAELDFCLWNSDSDCEGDIRMGLTDYLARIPTSYTIVGISRQCDSHWEWFVSNAEPSYKITGKYLFFSRSRKVLADIACEEIGSRRFHLAKIPVEGKANCDEYVLCLYYSDDSLKHELADKYRDREDLKYRYWKSDESTRRGEYSPQFLNRLALSNDRTEDHGSECSGSPCVSTSDDNPPL